MKLKNALELFLAVDRARQTTQTYAKFLRPFVLAIGPERPLDIIQPVDIAVFVNDMKERTEIYADHPKRPTVAAGLAPMTVFKNVKMIKTFFSWCVKQGYLVESPAAFLVNRRPIRPLGMGKAATDEELAAMLDAARYKPRDYALMLLLAQSGCRAGEAAGLRIGSLDLERLIAYVNGKGNLTRPIYFCQEAAEAMDAWLKVRPKVKHDFVFTSTRGHQALTGESVSDVVRRLSRTVGLSRTLGAHSLRHRVGLIFARMHVAPRVTQHYLGHTNIKTTLEYYQDVDESDLRNASHLLQFNGQELDWREEVKKNPAAKLLKPRTG
jgi:integrase